MTDSFLLSVFHYDPSVPASVIFLILYFVIAFPLAWLSIRTRTPMTFILAGTAIAESLGYVFRLACTESPSLGLYIIMDLLILLSPNALALVNYKVLGQVIVIKSARAELSVKADTLARVRIPMLMDHRGMIIGSRVSSIFFASDVIGFLLQAAGGGMQAAGSFNAGTDLLLFGLSFQLIFFALFTTLTVYVYTSSAYNTQIVAANPSVVAAGHGEDTIIHVATGNDGSEARQNEQVMMNKVFFCLFTTISLLFIRNIYRLAEFSEGYNGYLASHEVFFYIFDSVIIFSAFCVYTIWHFGLYLPAEVTISRVQTNVVRVK